MLNAGVLLVRIFHRFLIGASSLTLSGISLSDDLLDFIGILPFDITEFIVKSPDGVAELIQIRVWLRRSLISTSSGRGELSGSPMALRWIPVGFNPRQSITHQ
ncbi:MAG: hypothetical protein PHI97_25900 [Desulfobulbus sp.]|nr:hypothetical protein [Desulfobulbus sp.]